MIVKFTCVHNFFFSLTLFVAYRSQKNRLLLFSHQRTLRLSESKSIFFFNFEYEIKKIFFSSGAIISYPLCENRLTFRYFNIFMFFWATPIGKYSTESRIRRHEFFTFVVAEAVISFIHYAAVFLILTIRVFSLDPDGENLNDPEPARECGIYLNDLFVAIKSIDRR